jgi:hypothetical protein
MQSKDTRTRAKKSTSTRRPSVKARARAIIADAERYDDETRHAINNALTDNSSDLAELVRRAEEGEEILDISRPLTIPLTLEHIRGRNPLIFDELAKLAASIVDFHPPRAAQLLLLVHVFTYCDPGERENLSTEIEDKLLPSLPGADDFRYTAMLRALEALRKGDE